jgi:hypothetical protein
MNPKLAIFIIGFTLGGVLSHIVFPLKKAEPPPVKEEVQVDQSERDKARQIYIAELFQFYETGCELPFKEGKKIDGTPEEFCKSKAFDFEQELEKAGLFK